MEIVFLPALTVAFVQRRHKDQWKHRKCPLLNGDVHMPADSSVAMVRKQLGVKDFSRGSASTPTLALVSVHGSL